MSIEHNDPYASGERVRVRVHARPGSYVTVLRVDTRGRIHVLYPATPRSSGLVGSAGAMAAPFGFQAEPTSGLGYVMAFVSAGPFDFLSLGKGGRWNLPREWRHISGDPLESLIRRVALLSSSFGYDQVAYRVGGTFEFPRFACTGCHTAVPGWDPYAGACTLVTVERIPTPADYMYRVAGPRSAVATASRPLSRLAFRLIRHEASPDAPPGRVQILDQWRGGGLPPPAWVPTRPRSTGKPALRRRVPGAGTERPRGETPTRPPPYR